MKASWIGVDIRESLTAYPLRTFLTAFAIATGTLTLTLLLGILASLDLRGRELIRDFGANRIHLEARKNGNPVLTPEDLRDLRGGFPALEIAAIRTDTFPATPGTSPPPVHTVEPGYVTLRDLRLRGGRRLDPADTGSVHALLDTATAQRLALAPGDLFTLHQTPFQLVGVIDAPPGLYLPPGRVGPWVRNQEHRAAWDAVWMAHPPHWSGPGTAAQVEALLRRTHPDAELRTTTPDQLLAATRNLSQTLRTVFGGVVALCLLLGGVTLSTLMTLNVQQRTPEIGLRMSLGARSRHIFSLFLTEGLLLTLLAGSLGTGIGHFLLPFAAERMDLPRTVSILSVILPLATALFTGILFSFPPARTAAALSPALALRRAGTP